MTIVIPQDKTLLLDGIERKGKYEYDQYIGLIFIFDDIIESVELINHIKYIVIQPIEEQI